MLPLVSFTRERDAPPDEHAIELLCIYLTQNGFWRAQVCATVAFAARPPVQWCLINGCEGVCHLSVRAY